MDAGRVVIEIPPEYESPFYVKVYGGADIDKDDDGERDCPIDNLESCYQNDELTMYFAITTDEVPRIVLNPLLFFASGHVLGGFDEGITYDNDIVDKINTRVAKALLKEDINGDELINWQDLSDFHPSNEDHQSKCRIPWRYVLDEVQEMRDGIFKELELNYLRGYYTDPMTQQLADFNNDGEWRDDRDTHIYPGSGFELIFKTNYNGYTIQDLVDGQGFRGGKVTLPGNQAISYRYQMEEGGEYFLVENDHEPPLHVFWWSDPSDGEGDLQAFIGGEEIIAAENAPTGIYRVEFTTGDEIDHDWYLHVPDNTTYTEYFIVPEYELNGSGQIDRMRFTFEDSIGNTILDPPILYGLFYMNGISNLNIIRGDGFYDLGEYNDLYGFAPNIRNVTEWFIPMNNGHKIYYEDIRIIPIWLIGGDSVWRSFFFMNDSSCPNYTELSFENGQVTTEFIPSTDFTPAREVTGLKYRFDIQDGWTEVQDNPLTVDIPEGAVMFYVMPKDTSGFYRNMEQLDLTQ